MQPAYFAVNQGYLFDILRRVHIPPCLTNLVPEWLLQYLKLRNNLFLRDRVGLIVAYMLKNKLEQVGKVGASGRNFFGELLLRCCKIRKQAFVCVRLTAKIRVKRTHTFV